MPKKTPAKKPQQTGFQKMTQARQQTPPNPAQTRALNPLAAQNQTPGQKPPLNQMQTKTAKKPVTPKKKMTAAAAKKKKKTSAPKKSPKR